MTNLHYHELAIQSPDLQTTVPKLMERAFYELRPFHSYLSQAQKWLIAQTREIGWADAEEPERAETLSSEPQPQAGLSRADPDRVPTWVRLEDPDTEDADELVDEFLEAPWLADRKSPKPNIRVLRRNAELGLLLLSRRPGGPKLFLLPDTTNLRRQLTALFRLQNSPLPEHRALLRLVEAEGVSGWPPVSPVRVENWFLLKDLSFPGTEEQRHFVETAIATPDFAILVGPPGSGKTISICEYILQELELGHRVLLCASTHVAVDNVLEKLVERGWTDTKVIPVRIGDETRVSDTAHRFLFSYRLEEERKRLAGALERLKSRTPSQDQLLLELKENPEEVITPIVLEFSNLTCGTTLGILKHPDLRGWDDSRQSGLPVRPPAYDVLIIDECSKTPFSEFLVPALLAKKWVLVGDTKQLSPYVEEGFLQANLGGIVPPEDGDVCTPFLDVRPSLQGVLVSPSSDEAATHLKQHAEALELTVSSLTEEPNNAGPQATLEAWGSDVVMIPSDLLRPWEIFLPPDLVNKSNVALPRHEGHRRAWLGARARTQRAGPQSSSMSEVEGWSYEVAWRMIRVFELRKDPTLGAEYRRIIDRLVPRWYPESGVPVAGPNGDEDMHRSQASVRRSINTLQRAAFPSVLELLQEGLPRLDFTRPVEEVAPRTLTAISVGLPPAALGVRSVALSYQHRMHPEISRIPRERVYNSELLKDPPDIEKHRQWGYRAYASRACWVAVHGRIRGGKNVNPDEAAAILRELENFRSWTRSVPPPKGRGEYPTWQVAVLTFYRPQEAELRLALQEMFRSRNRQRFVDPHAHLEVQLGTVDRFQGQEADMVFLSFVRTRGIGFLDNPNRLNVALTRARFQLVLVGHKEHFARNQRSEFLKAVATELSGSIALRGG